MCTTETYKGRSVILDEKLPSKNHGYSLNFVLHLLFSYSELMKLTIILDVDLAQR